MDNMESNCGALRKMFNEHGVVHTINRRAINALLNGRHAKIGGRSRAARGKNLLKIAASYSWEEILTEPGIGPVIATEIKAWVEAQGASLRMSEQTAARRIHEASHSSRRE